MLSADFVTSHLGIFREPKKAWQVYEKKFFVLGASLATNPAGPRIARLSHFPYRLVGS
jgi:hypothetical protein